LQFCYGDYVVYKGKSLYTINESSIIDSFQDLLNDLDTLTYASYFCELIDICMQDEESNRELFRNLVTAFYLIKNKVVDIETLARAYELKV
jgi:DNA repair protein RecO (recombination protein O)